MVSKTYLDKYPGSPIVHDVRTSRATEEYIKEWGGIPIRTKAGRVNIGSKMREVNAPFGGETSGHLFFKENYDADSGLIAALVGIQAISDSKLKLSQLVDQYRRYDMIPERNLEVKQDKDIIFSNLKQLFQADNQEELDGLTVSSKEYWFNLRASNTEPVMRLNAEAINKEILNSIVNKVVSVAEKKQVTRPFLFRDIYI